VILTPDRRLRVFISSTLDLRAARAAARRAVESLELTPVMFEEGARPHPPRALYHAYVEQSDVFVAVYSRRYGWTAPDMEISGLEDEYNLSGGMPRLVYIERGVEREPELDAFLERVRDDGLSYRPFTDDDELETVLKRDLVALLTERFRDAEPGSAAHAAAPPAPLPIPPTRFLGRDAELEAIEDRLANDAARLVTLLGPGGIGKTRLAIAAAQRFTSRFPGGTFFVPLADLRDPGLIGQAVAAALGVAPTDSSSAVAAVAEFLRDRRALLVLDNFEPVVAGAPTVAQLLEACPELTVMVSSRTALRLRDEREIDVGPLAVPEAVGGSRGPETYAAVQLFTEAARAVRPAFSMDERSGAVVAEICRLLDGLPLALELAAAMVRILTPEALLERLRKRRTDLGLGLRDMPERHRTIRATIAWSYDLLDDPAKELLEQLGVFRGGFTLERAEEICEVEDVVGTVATLAEHSLVRTEVHCGCGARFSMLGTIRQFAADRLEARAGAAALRFRHARAFVELAGAVDGPGGRDAVTLDEVEVDLDNVRQAFEWLLATGETEEVAAAMGRSWWFWWIRGYVAEGKLWAERCLASTDAASPDAASPDPASTDLTEAARALALLARAMLAVWSGEYEAALPAFEAAAAGGDRRTAAYADIGVGLVRAITTSVTEGRRLIARGVAALADVGDDAGFASGLAASAWVQGITRAFDDDEQTLRDGLARVRATGSDVDVGIVESALAQLLMRDGPTPTVGDLLASALERFARARHIGSTILTLEVIAELALGASAAREATVVLGATAAIRQKLGTRVPPAAAARLERLVGQARASLGEGFGAAFELGSAMGYAEAVDRGRTLLARLRPAR
jgi:predicted ATPase